MDILRRVGVRLKQCGETDGRVAVAVSIRVHEQGFRDHGNAKHSDQPVVLLSGPQGVVIDGRCDQPCGAAGDRVGLCIQHPVAHRRVCCRYVLCCCDWLSQR